jgi:hypothetical protein
MQTPLPTPLLSPLTQGKIQTNTKNKSKLLPRVRHAWLIQEWSDDVVATTRAADIECMCPRANALTPAAVAAAKAQGFGVRAWGVKSLEVSCGVFCFAH